MKQWGTSNLVECAVLLDSDSAAKLERLARQCGTSPEHLAGHILCVLVDRVRYHGTPEDAHEFDVPETRFHVSGAKRGG